MIANIAVEVCISKKAVRIRWTSTGDNLTMPGQYDKPIGTNYTDKVNLFSKFKIENNSYHFL